MAIAAVGEYRMLNHLRASFAVVGHPNKGKSSIVSTLARDDSILISQQSGTTTQSTRYKIDTGHAGFELVDTPGFQRPRKVLHWLQLHAQSADQRALAVEKFVNDLDCQKKYPDEVELLTPLTKGSAILYVVDGSRPYGVEYEAEMEILRWTGQPSMALINPIENDSFIDSWKNALEQFFKIVRVFNPMHADFDKQLSLLEAFSHLQPKWKNNLDQVIIDLKDQQHQLADQSATILAQLLTELCSYQCQQKVLTEAQAKALEPILSKRYNQWMCKKESQSHQQMLDLFSHQRCELNASSLALPPDLFDSEQWYAWGLNKKQLASVSAMTGAAAGAALDFAVAGHSFMLGAIGGGALGFTSAWLGANKITNVSVKGLPLGGYQALQGPIKNRNFPYVVIARFLYLFEQLQSKNHADRSGIDISEAISTETIRSGAIASEIANTETSVASNILQNKLDELSKSQLKAIHNACNQLVSQKAVDDLSQVLSGLFLE